MEDKQRYVFLKTIEKGGVVSALIADAEVLGDGGVRSMQLAFNANAAPVSRVGMLPMTIDQLLPFVLKLEELGMDKSLEGTRERPGIRRAVTCLLQKGVDPQRTPLGRATAQDPIKNIDTLLKAGAKV